jgi:hypothetical protein
MGTGWVRSVCVVLSSGVDGGIERDVVPWYTNRFYNRDTVNVSTIAACGSSSGSRELPFFWLMGTVSIYYDHSYRFTTWLLHFVLSTATIYVCGTCDPLRYFSCFKTLIPATNTNHTISKGPKTKGKHHIL